MKILIITRGVPTKKYPLFGVFEFDQAKALADRGCTVVFAAVDIRSLRRWRKWGFSQYKKQGVQVFSLSIPGGRIGYKGRTLLISSGLNYLYKKINKKFGVPDIVHAHFPRNGYSALKLCRKENLPYVYTEHLSKINSDSIDKKLVSWVKKIYKEADAVIAVSSALKNSIEKRFNFRPVVVPNSVDAAFFTHIEKRKHDTFTFVSVGWLISSKAMDITIKAFIKAFAENSHVQLVIIGEGPQRKYLQQLIDVNYVQGKVFLKGQLEREKIAGIFSRSDCFVLASKSETFGVAYIEAMAAGLPVIATKCGGPEGFVNDQNGLLVPVDHQNSLSDAMQYMHEHINDFDGKRISKEIKNKFSPNSVAEQLLYLYQSIINEEQL